MFGIVHNSPLNFKIKKFLINLWETRKYPILYYLSKTLLKSYNS